MQNRCSSLDSSTVSNRIANLRVAEPNTGRHRARRSVGAQGFGRAKSSFQLGFVDSLEQNRCSSLDSSTVSSRIVVPAWNRRQSRTESFFHLEIIDSLEQNRCSSLESSTVSNRIAILRVAEPSIRPHRALPSWFGVIHLYQLR